MKMLFFFFRLLRLSTSGYSNELLGTNATDKTMSDGIVQMERKSILLEEVGVAGRVKQSEDQTKE